MAIIHSHRVDPITNTHLFIVETTTPRGGRTWGQPAILRTVRVSGPLEVSARVTATRSVHTYRVFNCDRIAWPVVRKNPRLGDVYGDHESRRSSPPFFHLAIKSCGVMPISALVPGAAIMQRQVHPSTLLAVRSRPMAPAPSPC